jgi:hypothetical protein
LLANHQKRFFCFLLKTTLSGPSDHAWMRLAATRTARSALIVGRDPNNPSTFVLASNKSNLGPMPRSLTYNLDPFGDVARVAWGSETDLTAADILSHPQGKGRQTVAEQSAEAIREILGSGVIESGELDVQCQQRGFSSNAIRDGRRLAKVRIYRVGFGPGAKYMAALGAEQESTDA